MPKRLARSGRRGPICFAGRLRETPKQAEAELQAAVEALWTSRQLKVYPGKSANGLSEFLNNTPGFPAFKIGLEWRADPIEVKARVRRKKTDNRRGGL